MSTPPPVGKTLSVKVDAQLYDDLTTMLAAGMTASNAVRTALRIVAGVYRTVWAAGHIPRAVQPIISRFFVAPYDAGQSVEERARQQGIPRPYRDRTTTSHTDTTADTTPGPTGPTPVRQAV